MTAKLVRFPGALMGFIQSFLEQVRKGATETELRALWVEHRGALRTDAPYQDLLEFFIAIDEATCACPPDSVGATPLPKGLEGPVNRRVRVVSPLAEYARRRYGGFQAAYAYTLPLEATFGADDPALFIAKAGAELFPLKDPVSPKDISPYASKDLSTLGVQGGNHWFVGELLQWAKPRIGSELTEFLRALVSGVFEKYVPRGAVFGELNDRMYDMLAVYSLKRAISHNDIQSAFGTFTSGADLRWAEITRGGALFYCLDQRSLDTLVKGAIRLGDEYDSESNCRTEKEYLFVCINDVIAAMVNRGAKRRAPFSLRTTKVIFDRLVYLCGVDSLGEVITQIPYDHYGRHIGYLMEPCLSAIIADSLSGGLLLEPVGDYSLAQNPESRFFSVGLSDSAVGRILGRARVSGERSKNALIHDAMDERFLPLGGDVTEFSFVRMPVYRYAIERAINATSFELASSIVAFLIFGAAFRTNGTFRLTRPYSQEARDRNSQLWEGADRLCRAAGFAIPETKGPFLDFNEDISDMLSLVPLGLGLPGGERVRKAVTVAAGWARKWS